jgi:isocitrate dehydrogenase
VHIGQADVAERVHNGWLKTIEDGIHTYDIYKEGVSKQKVGTKEFAQAVVDRVGQRPQQLKAVEYRSHQEMGSNVTSQAKTAKKELVGVDVYLDRRGKSPADDLAKQLEPASVDGLKLVAITNRGVRVWPGGLPETFCIDHWRCRFMGRTDTKGIARLLERLDGVGVDVFKTENLYEFDGQVAYSVAQAD